LKLKWQHRVQPSVTSTARESDSAEHQRVRQPQECAVELFKAGARHFIAMIEQREHGALVEVREAAPRAAEALVRPIRLKGRTTMPARSRENAFSGACGPGLGLTGRLESEGAPAGIVMGEALAILHLAAARRGASETAQARQTR
jgi:hypothetical protein